MNTPIKYKFIKTLGKGASSSVDLAKDENGNNVVIKHCNKENKHTWKQECLKEISITSSLAKTNPSCNFPTSRIENIDGEDIMVSTFIQGKELSKDVLEELPEAQQKQIAKDLGTFLYHLHNQSIKQQEQKSSSHSLDIFNKKGKKLKERLNLLPAEVQEQINHVISDFDGDTNYGKINVLCHNDLIKDNLLYDKNSQKLSVIDFGDTENNDIYTDFAYLMRAGQLGDKFGINVINAYNKINQENNTGICINTHTAKKLAILLSLKKIKKLDKINNPERTRFIIYMQEYEKCKTAGMYKTNTSDLLSYKGKEI